MPTAAEKIDLEVRISGEAEVKWKSVLAEAEENLEASKLTIQNLLKENLFLKTNLQYVTAESEKRAGEIQWKFDKTVIISGRQTLSRHPQLSNRGCCIQRREVDKEFLSLQANLVGKLVASQPSQSRHLIGPNDHQVQEESSQNNHSQHLQHQIHLRSHYPGRDCTFGW